MALQVEGVVNRTVNAEEALGRSSRLEPLQLALASSDCLMRVLHPVVLSEPPLMRTDQTETAHRRSVGEQLVGDQQFRRKPLLLEQLCALAATPLGCRVGAGRACRGPRREAGK